MTRGAAVRQSRRASDDLVEQLRGMILTMELPPGGVYAEEALSELLGCSRTPLREAVQRLSYEHLVVSVPRRGVAVAELSMLDLGHLLEAIGELESIIAGLAAQRITDDQLLRLEESLAASEVAEQAKDFVLLAQLDFNLHQILAEATGNPYLQESSDILFRLEQRFVVLGFRRAGTARGAIEDHTAILAALRRRDPGETRRAIDEHWHHGRERMRAAF